MPEQWQQDGDRWVFDDIEAERAADDNAFVIVSFGAEPNADLVFTSIKAAMQFGMIRLRVTPETNSTIKKLTGDGRIKCAATVGSEHEELGVMAIQQGSAGGRPSWFSRLIRKISPR